MVDNRPCSSSPTSSQKRARRVTKTAFIRLHNLHLPLISAATGSPVDSLSLDPDRPYTIGRSSSNCDFAFNNRHVSKRHLQILFDGNERKIYLIDGTFLLHDVSCVVDEFRKRRLLCGDRLLVEEGKEGVSRLRVSLNGVFVNGVRIEKGIVRELNAGDEVLLVCGNRNLCRSGIRIGFVIVGVVFKEEVVTRLNDVVLERPRLLGTTASSGHSQGSVSSGKRNKRVFALQLKDVRNLDCDFSRLKHHDVFERSKLLLSQCRDILNSDDPIGSIRQCDISKAGAEISQDCSTKKIQSTCKFSITGDLKVENDKFVYVQEQTQCDRIIHSQQVTALEADCELVNQCVRGDLFCHKDSTAIPSESNVIAHDTSNPLLLECGGMVNASDFDKFEKNKQRGRSCLPPGKNFYLNHLESMYSSSPNQTVVSLPELLYPIENISRIFIATFTSDIPWFFSHCEIPHNLPVTVACHNTARCWSSSPDDRISVPYPDFPNVVVVFPPFPESIAFGENLKKQGIACHHPKLFVLQREDSIRIIITSANLVAKQWNNITNTIWWQDFPRRNTPDYFSLFLQAPEEEIAQDSKPDFAAQLASFMASLVIDVPSEAHWVIELTKYDFSKATGHLVASVPGIYSYRSLEYIKYDVKFLGSVEASVVGLNHLFRTAADTNGAQLKKLASFLGRSCENTYGMLEIVLRRNNNVPADVNAVNVLVPDPDKFSETELDCVQLGFLPRNVAKWVSPLWDVGFFKFSGFICRDEVLAAALAGVNKKVQLILHVSQGPSFSDISTMMQPQHVVALSFLIASIQRCRGLWRLQEVLGQYRWPESQESDFIYGSSSVGSLNAQFLAAFAAAAGKKSSRFFDSEESDPEWGCWSASQELKSPSIRILFPTIDRVKTAHDGIWPSKRVLCFSEKTWQRLHTLDILHDAVPHPYDRVGHPMHVKVARRRFQSRRDTSSFGWVYSGSHNFSAAAWGRLISNTSAMKANLHEKTKSSSSLRLHISNYELGIIFIFPPTETKSSTEKNNNNLDDIFLPFTVPAPKYKPRDRPATPLAMREALAELSEQQKLEHVEVGGIEEEMMEEVLDEDEEVVQEAGNYVAAEKEKEEENAYAEMLWSQVDSSQSC